MSCKLQAANTATGFADVCRFGPNPSDTSISKRQWEKLKHQWRREVAQRAETIRMMRADQEARAMRERDFSAR